MGSRSDLKNILHRPGLTNKQVVLICLGSDGDSAKTVKEVRDRAVNAGVRRARNWNISQLLSDAKGMCARTDAGWELTDAGKAHVEALRTGGRPSRVVNIAPTLRSCVKKLKDPGARAFVEEAISCFEAGFFRAAVVLSWVGAIALLHAHVLANCLVSFNNEAKRRNAKWKQAKTTDDLGIMKESEFLDVLQSISVLGKNVKQELQPCLTLRNSCGHPSSLKLGVNRVAGHIEILILNVYSRFKV